MIDSRIVKQQGFVVISPKGFNTQGALIFTREGALEHKKIMDDWFDKYPEGFDLNNWPEKPEPWQVYELMISKRIV